MSDATSPAFPPNGKVLVVNMTIRGHAEHKFNSHVYWKSSWELNINTPPPDGVVVMILPGAMKPDPLSNMKSWAQRHKVRVEIEPTVESLLKTLTGWFANGNATPVPEPPSRPLPSPSPRGPRPVPPPPPSTQASKPDVASPGEIMLDSSRVKPLEGQPRTHFSTKAMNELTTSIRAIGQITPIIVRVLDGDPNYDYELIEGERRLRVCILLGSKISAVVRKVKNREDQYKKSFAANFQREGHTPLETARYIKSMLDFPEYTGLGKMAALKAIASIPGKTDVWAFNYLKLLELPEEVQAMLEPDDADKSALPQGMGLFLCSIQSKKIQLQVCREAVSKELSVAKAKHFARQLAAKEGVQVGSAERTPKADYNIARNCLRRAKEGVEHTLTMPNRSVDELFLNRPLEDRRSFLQEIDELINSLTTLRDQADLKKRWKK